MKLGGTQDKIVNLQDVPKKNASAFMKSRSAQIENQSQFDRRIAKETTYKAQESETSTQLK